MPGKGNPHVRIRVDPTLKQYLRGYALAHKTTTARVVRDALAEWMYERVDPTPSKRVDHSLHRLDVLCKQLQLKIAVLPAEGEMAGSEPVVVIAGDVRIPGHGTARHGEGTGPQARVDTVKERETLYWIVVDMLKEAQKLSENEDLAKKAGSRIGAMTAAGALARVGEMILSGYDRAYIQPHLDELTNLIEQLKDQLKQTNQKSQENPTGSTAA